MAIENIKQELSGGKPGSKPGVQPEKISPPPKEEKKDTSIFRGGPGMERGTFDHKLSDPEMYRGTELGSSRISELGKKLFEGKDYIKKSDLECADSELDLGKWGEYKDFSEKDKLDSKKLIRKLLGEKK